MACPVGNTMLSALVLFLMASCVSLSESFATISYSRRRALPDDRSTSELSVDAVTTARSAFVRDHVATRAVCSVFASPAWRRASQSRTALKMCICINCARVTNCAAYHFVEEKHEQPYMTENPTFTPRDGSPTIHVNVRTSRTDSNKAEVARLWSEHKREQEIAAQRAKEASAAVGVAANDDTSDVPLRGQEVYDLSVSTTYEYDVVKCEDFVEDQGCWVRNMPEEIRLANPDFVPT